MKNMLKIIVLLSVVYSVQYVMGKDNYAVKINYAEGPSTEARMWQHYRGEIPYKCSKNANAIVYIINDDGSLERYQTIDIY